MFVLFCLQTAGWSLIGFANAIVFARTDAVQSAWFDSLNHDTAREKSNRGCSSEPLLLPTPELDPVGRPVLREVVEM